MNKLLLLVLFLISSQLSAQNLAVVQNFAPGIGSVDSSSMGFGGEIIAKFESPVSNNPGKDVYIEESSISTNRWPEKVRVYFSQDSCNWVYSGEIYQSDSIDIAGFVKIQWIKLIDSSDPNESWIGETSPNGYDIVSISANNIASNIMNTGRLPFYPRFVTYSQGLRKDGTIVEEARSNAINSLNEPENTDQGYNFFSLGMGGWAIYSFDFAIFDGAGIDITVVETSWNSPSCQNWKERAIIEGAYDIEGPYTLIGEICLDGSLDIENSGLNGFHYLKITDRSPASSFNGNADGYDVDGIIAHHQCDIQQTSNSREVIREIEREVRKEKVSTFNAEVKRNNYFVIKNFYGVVMKEGPGEPNMEGLKPGAYVLEFSNEGSIGRKMLIVQGDRQ